MVRPEQTGKAAVLEERMHSLQVGVWRVCAKVEEGERESESVTVVVIKKVAGEKCIFFFFFWEREA